MASEHSRATARHGAPLLAWLAALCCLLFPLPSHAQNPAAVQRLTRAEKLLQQAEHQPRQARALARQAAAGVPAGTCPQLTEAAHNPSPENIARAREEVTSLRQATALRPAGNANTAQAHVAVRQVLERGEFQEIKRSKLPQPAQRLLQWLKGQWMGFARSFGKAWKAFLRWWERHMPHFQAPRARAPWVGAVWNVLRYVLLGVLALAILFLLGLLISRLLAGWQQERAPEGPQKAEASRRRQEPTLWERSLAQAVELWHTGQQREATRLLQRACLVLLDARGVLRFDETRANGEVLRELRRLGRTNVQDALRPIVRGFDRSWYGFLPLTNDEFNGMLEHSRQFRNAVVGES